MYGTLPSGASSTSQPFSWTIVPETTIDGLSLFHNIFTDTGNNRGNSQFVTDDMAFFKGNIQTSTSHFWNTRPDKVVVTINHISTGTVEVYINNRWVGEATLARANDEVILFNDAPGFDFPMNGYIYECFYTNDSLTEKQISNIHHYLNEKWDIFNKPIVDIFTMSGQSNMVGRGDSTQSPNPEYGFFLDPQYWNSSRTRMNTIIDPVGTANTLNQATTGCCIPAFCQEYYEQTGRIPVILHVCDGGTSIFTDSEWNPDYSGSNYSDDVINILNSAENHLSTAGWEIGKSLYCGIKEKTMRVQLFKRIKISS
jgi:hypothetical protein